MKIDVCRQRRNDSTPGRSCVADRYASIFRYPCLEESLYHALNTLVLNPVRQKFHQPFLIHMIEKAFDIGLHDVVDRLVLHLSRSRL